MKLKFAILASLFALTLLGCAAKPLEVGTITKIKAPAGTQGTDVYHLRRKNGEQVPAFAGDQILEVRTYANQESKDTGIKAGDEMAKATCRVEARDYSADVVTPAKLRVPIYRTKSSPLSVSCQKPGYKPSSVVVEVFNKTKEQRRDTASAAGAGAGIAGVVAGLLVAEIINASSDETAHEFKYRPVRVKMDAENVVASARTPANSGF